MPGSNLRERDTKDHGFANGAPIDALNGNRHEERRIPNNEEERKH